MSGTTVSADQTELAAATPTSASFEHFARFYTHDETLAESVATYVADSLRGGAAAIVIATEQHSRSIQAHWATLQFDTTEAMARGQMIVLDAAETLDKFMIQGMPDRDRFLESVGKLVERACEGWGRVAAFGEMVSLLWADNKAAAAVELESLWNELGQRYRLRLFCGYALQDCTLDQGDEAFEAVCGAHSYVIPAESYDSSSSDAQRKLVVHLQRKALALELRLSRDREIQRSIAHMAAIIEGSEDAIISKTLEGVIQSWNTGAQRLFGYEPEEAIGKSVALIVPPELLDDEQRILQALRRGERIEQYETSRLGKDGRHVDVSLTISPIRDESGGIVGASSIARDITDRKRADRMLRDAHHDLQTRTAELARFNTAALGRETRILALKREVNELYTRLGKPAVYSVDDTASDYRVPFLAYSSDPPPEESSEPSEGLVSLESILITEQLHQRPTRSPDYEAQNRALAALVQTLATTPENILQALADRVLETLQVGSAGLSLLTKDGRRFYWAAIAGGWSPHAGGGTPREFGPCGDVLDRDAPLLFTHWERRYPYLAAATPLAEEGLLVPFYVGGRSVGTIWAIVHDVERKLDAEDLRLLQSLAQFAAVAYQAVSTLGVVEERSAALSLLEDAVQSRSVAEESLAKLRDSEQRLACEAAELAKLNHWSSRLWACRDLREGLEVMLDAVIELMEADKGNVQLLQAGGILTIAAQRGFDRDFLDYFCKVDASDDSACRALRSGQPVIIEDVDSDEPYAPLRPIAHVAGYRAVLSVPLTSGDGTPQGMLSTHFRSPHRPSDSQLGRLVLYARHASDFIHRCKVEQVLRRSEEALREADRRKDEFLALLAHELRNPLAPIRYALAANRKGDRTPEQRRRADEIMERQVAHMGRLLDDLLDIARITRGTLELKKAPTELISILSAAIETARPLLDSRHHKLSLQLPNEAVRLHGDPVRLSQVFSNLLINAAKYTDPHGEVCLRARRENNEILIAVRDNGIGIAPEVLPRLFTMFAQADGARGRAEGGLGVGLALVRGIIALHGGKVRAHSDGLGLGSEFIVTLAALEPETAVVELESVEDVPTSNRSARVLVVDDNRDAADTCAALLELSGHHVQTAYSAREALDLASSFQPNVLLLDIGLPDLDGYALAKRIRETSWGRHAVLIAITGWGQSADRDRAQEAGFDHHLTKPVAAEILESTLERFAGQRLG